ncbi:hypothetical protein K1719_033455 [Acacia pycnantha]|nr:hypothetical protein K1719_033455 [Acacia pycnantha]
MEKSCTLLVRFNKGTPALANEILEALERNDDATKIDAMKKAIMLLLYGDTNPQLFIAIIRNVLPSEDHNVQRLLLLYLEIIEKTDSKGKVLPDMILICQNLRNNLQHPNEYIRGVTLQFLCRLNETEIIEPLIPCIHSLQFGASPSFCSEECRPGCHDRAINYLLTHIDRINDWGEQLQMVVLELIRKVCRTTNKGEKGKYIKISIPLLNASSSAVIYECARTLVSLSSAPTAIRVAATTYCQLLLSHGDHNVKLIVLDRLNELTTSNRDIMVEMVTDVLRALSTINEDIRMKIMDIALELITPRNIDEVVMMLKNEVVRIHAKIDDFYKPLLVQTIHSCASKFPEVASTVVHLLMDYLGDENWDLVMDVVVFVREIIETNPKLRDSIVTRLLGTFNQIRATSALACAGALWIIGEYCQSLAEVESGIATIKQCLRGLPFYTPNEEGEGEDTSKSTPLVSSISVENALFPPTLVQGLQSSTGNLKSLIFSEEEVQTSKVEVNKATTQALLIMVSILQLGQSSVCPIPIDNDSHDRIVFCIRLLCNTGGEVRKIWLQYCRQSFVKMLSDEQLRETKEIKAKAQISKAQHDVLIDFYHLKSRKACWHLLVGMSQLELEDEVQDDLKRATGEFTKDTDDENKLNRILQLTGFSDPVYAEAYVTVNRCDIVLDVTVINRTKETLHNLCLELATMGGLKLVERPQNYTLTAESSKQIKANIMVSSTETGVIFGNILYETPSNVLERTIIVLNDIHIDIMDYIYPASCTGAGFRYLWTQCKWENKVAVTTTIQDEREFLNHILKCTNMKCLTPPSAFDGECGFLAANLYGKTVFGEEAFVNISIEKQADDKLSGFIRIKSKNRGISRSLADKITLKQRGGT